MTDSFWTSEIVRPGLCAGVITGILSAWYGCFVIQRGLGFLSAGLAHAAFGGVALGLLLGVSQPLLIALPFVLAVALCITALRHRSGMRYDTAIGIFFSVSMAFGMIVLSYRNEFSSDAMSYLFGDLLFVQWVDVLLCGILFVLSLACLPLWSCWAYASFDFELAQSDKLAAKRHDYILIIMIAILVAAVVKIAGIILASAFFVIPPATAALLSRQFSQMTIYAVVIGALSVCCGMYLGYQLNWPSGAAIIVTQTCCLICAVCLKRFG
ncbi:MAG: metal ABC transporter permease [Planctomycetes bacterium]|nr:metal ABC transporter permease [Planctomycetota bacterium]